MARHPAHGQEVDGPGVLMAVDTPAGLELPQAFVGPAQPAGGR